MLHKAMHFVLPKAILTVLDPLKGGKMVFFGGFFAIAAKQLIFFNFFFHFRSFQMNNSLVGEF